MRRAFSNTLLRIFEADDRVIFLTGDLGFGVFDDLIARFPKRYINVGVAEAQLVNCAAGLAMEGWRPIVYSIASFMTGRAFEQIRISIGYHRLPVMVVGAGGGYTYATSGVTHHAREDFALMALIPGMAIVAPGDPHEVEALLPQLIEWPGPSYIRIGRFGEPAFEAEASVEIGRGRIVREGKRVAVLTTAGSVIHAIEAWEVLARRGMAPMVCHFHTLAPFDVACFDTIAEQVNTIVIVEDHAPLGGLEAVVTRRLASTGRVRNLVRLGPGEDLILGNPDHEQLRREFLYDSAGIVETCDKAFRSA
jgi:transketolase